MGWAPSRLRLLPPQPERLEAEPGQAGLTKASPAAGLTGGRPGVRGAGTSCEGHGKREGGAPEVTLPRASLAQGTG